MVYRETSLLTESHSVQLSCEGTTGKEPLRIQEGSGVLTSPGEADEVETKTERDLLHLHPTLFIFRDSAGRIKVPAGPGKPGSLKEKCPEYQNELS